MLQNKRVMAVQQMLNGHYIYIRLPLALLRVRAPLVATWLAIQAEQNDKPKSTDDRHKGDEEPPATLINIVKTTNAYSDAWDKDCYRIYDTKPS